METYEDHPWCLYNSQSGEDDDYHDRYLARVRARSNSRSNSRSDSCSTSRSNSHSRRRSSFLVDELDMLMDKAAITIQANWRGHLVRKHLASEHAAATTIQAAWRGFITREYMALQQNQEQPWQPGRQRMRTPSLVSSEDERARPWQRYRPDKEQAATVIQAHYRGYVTRRAFCECKQAATTIQAHWRGYRTRQELARQPKGYNYSRSVPTKIYHNSPSYNPGSTGWMGPYPRKHWRKCMVGTPEEWARKVPRTQPSSWSQPTPQAQPFSRSQPSPQAQPCPREKDHGGTGQPKTCPRCGRRTSVRVLVGVGKGAPTESEVDESEGEGRARSPAALRKSPTRRMREQQASPRPHLYGPHVSYRIDTRAYSPEPQGMMSEEQPRRQTREPGGPTQRFATTYTAPRLTRERNVARSFSSTSIYQPGPPFPGSSDWLYENYCTRRMGEGQKRVFKTRKQMWQIARAATLIQSFWRGWKVRQALRQQQQAAIKIQSAYRGYKTRIFLIEAGVLSEGDTD